MSTQYDSIGAAYNSFKLLPAAQLERANLQAAIAPYIANAAVLDLACGTGYYSHLLLAWGARSVVGFDISQSMIDVAESSVAPEEQGRLSFHVGDCAKPVKLEGGEFDLVLGAWFLNYAEGAVEMAQMFRNVAVNLKPGGRFLGITPHPTDDLEALARKYRDAPERSKYGVSVRYGEQVAEGWKTHVTGHTEPVEVHFDNFHLRKSVYERSAREGGMKGDLAWTGITLPVGDENRAYGVEASYWDGYMDAPHFGLLAVQK